MAERYLQPSDGAGSNIICHFVYWLLNRGWITNENLNFDLRIERVLLVPYFYLINFFFIQQLAQKCDILVENYLPGKLDKFGLGYDNLKTSVPSLIYCSVTGYGTGGPYEQQPGYDVVVSGIGGLIHITGPEVHRTRTLDILGIENLVPRVLSLPRERNRKGPGNKFVTQNQPEVRGCGKQSGG